jgi:hypothetical protein
MRQDPLDQLRLLDACDHPQPPTATATLLNVDGEHSLHVIEWPAAFDETVAERPS